MHGVEEPLVLVEGQEGRVGQVPHELHLRPRACRGIDPVHPDALSPGIALLRGPAADVGEPRPARGPGLRSGLEDASGRKGAAKQGPTAGRPVEGGI